VSWQEASLQARDEQQEQSALRPVSAPSKNLFERIGRTGPEGRGGGGDSWWLVDWRARRAPPRANPSVPRTGQCFRRRSARDVKNPISPFRSVKKYGGVMSQNSFQELPPVHPICASPSIRSRQPVPVAEVNQLSANPIKSEDWLPTRNSETPKIEANAVASSLCASAR